MTTANFNAAPKRQLLARRVVLHVIAEEISLIPGFAVHLAGIPDSVYGVSPNRVGAKGRYLIFVVGA